MKDENQIFLDAKSYENNSTMQYKASLRLLQQYKFNGNEVVLDIGCGYGALANLIASEVPSGSVIGIDNSPSMIKLAQEKYQHENLQFYKMSAESFLFDDQKFDLIVSTFCLQWPKDKLGAFKLIKAHLKENGSVLLIMPLKNPLLTIARSKLRQSPKWKIYFKDYVSASIIDTASDYKGLADQANLQLYMSTENETTYFQNVESFKAFLKNITHELSVVPSELQDEFMNDYIHELCLDFSVVNNEQYEINFTYVKLTSFPIV